MSRSRRCTRSACGRPATATLTYVYADSTAVVGPLATYAEPHSYDLCDAHAGRLVAPRGWEVIRLAPQPDAGPSGDDLLALADAVREAARPAAAPVPPRRRGAAAPPTRSGGPRDPGAPAGAGAAPGAEPGARRGHLSVVRGLPAEAEGDPGS